MSDLLVQYKNRLATEKNKIIKVLPAELNSNLFLKQAYISIAQKQKEFANISLESIMLAVSKAASDGLIPDGREAAIIPQKKYGTARYQPMVDGLIKLARQSEQIVKIVAEVVYENDYFDYQVGMDFPVHKPDWFSNRGKPVGVWAGIKLINNEWIIAILSEAEVLNIASYGYNKEKYMPEHKDGKFFASWWKKTALRQALKLAPRDTRIQRAIDSADEEFIETFGSQHDDTEQVQEQAQEQQQEVQQKQSKRGRPKKLEQLKENIVDTAPEHQEVVPEKVAVETNDIDNFAEDAIYEDIPI